MPREGMMRNKGIVAITAFLIIALIGPLLPGCARPVLADSYTVIIPSTLQAGSDQAIPVTLFQGDAPAKGVVELALFMDEKEISRAKQNINGKGSIQLEVPIVDEGEYLIQVKGDNFQDEANIRIENNYIVFVETDKPIYKPGQTIRMRVVTLDSDLIPLSETVTVEVLDAKGIKIFRSPATTDEHGMATLDLPISTEPNLGVWKITTVTEKAKTQMDIKVEEYVLPKYEVKLELPKEWFLVDEQIKGKVTAEYSFGKPVRGELEIKALRYVGQWQEYATFSKAIDGATEFDIPAAGYVAGVSEAGGLGNVQLEVAVVEKSTNYEEKTTKLLTVAESSINLQIIPSGPIFKPDLPYSFLVITETPDNIPVDAEVKVHVTYLDKDFKEIDREERVVETNAGKALEEVTPPGKSTAMILECFVQDAHASKVVEAGYSPSGNFIHIEQTSEGIPSLGEDIRFEVYSTSEARNFYYEVISRGKVVFTDFVTESQITFGTTPQMAPSSRLLVYQILPNSEVAADYLPFKVDALYLHDITADFSESEVRPGDELDVNIETEGEARVGIAAVDKSVFILAENRLNLQQVFEELERLYMEPQAELHEISIYESITTRGAKEIFEEVGVVILTNNSIPEGKEYENERQLLRPRMMVEDAGRVLAPAPAPMPASAPSAPKSDGGLADVQRIRQYFPETWLWETVTTDAAGKASLTVTAPDSITTWMLRAVALSKDAGLGVAESQLKVFQPFFLTIDLPYSAIRGEEFPVSVAVYNYLNEPQDVLVQIQQEDWFKLLDASEQSVEIAASDIGSAEFRIRPVKLGTNSVKVTARSRQAADAVVKELIIEAEGVYRELVDNLILSEGLSEQLDTSVPPFAVEGSGRAYLTMTSSYLTQTIEGLETLLQMPFGCGEQNMIVFAPDVYITKYLRESGQLKPEIMAKAEMLMLTGYQRELTYRRSDGSFSAFGQQDQEGSLWLTAFVLKCFSQAKDLIYIDEEVLDQAKAWITGHQNSDGSFDAVGFVHHQEMIGGVQGKTALTAYVAIALIQAGDTASSTRAVGYLEDSLDDINDPYTMALTTYTLELAGSDRAGDAYQQLMALAQEDENGLYWGSGAGEPMPLQSQGKIAVPEPVPPVTATTAIEATGYATLALTEHGDALNASRAAGWLTSKRNAYGGYGSTQDTVVALEALTEYGTGARSDVDLTVEVDSEGNTREFRVTPDNFDILQVMEITVNSDTRMTVRGKGEAVAQVVRRFNLPKAEKGDEVLKIDVDYDVTEVAVNDLVKVSARLAFSPPEPMETGMIVLDISVPTGFEPVRESVEEVVQQHDKIKRYDQAGRKVIFYIENMLMGENIAFGFNVRAMYPVKAKGATSQAYSYYKPEIRGETIGEEVTVQ
jgi:CD109 antigen